MKAAAMYSFMECCFIRIVTLIVFTSNAAHAKVPVHPNSSSSILPFLPTPPTTISATSPFPPGRWLAGCDVCGGDADVDEFKERYEEGGGSYSINQASECMGSFRCFEEYGENIVANMESEAGSTCSCARCSTRYTFSVNCDLCNECFGTYCMDAQRGFGWHVDRDDEVHQASHFVNVTTSGEFSANNNVFAEILFTGIDRNGVVFEMDDLDDCQVTIEGTLCNNCHGLFNADSCFELDCTNIDSEYSWNCDDTASIESDNYHPIHGLFVAEDICPNPLGLLRTCEQGSSSCTQYTTLMLAHFGTDTCTCNTCATEYDVDLNCEPSYACLDEYCYTSQFGGKFIEEGLSHVPGIFYWNMTSTGPKSASNNVYVEQLRFSPQGEQYSDDCNLYIDGIRCKECVSAYWDNSIDSCTIDCSNIDPEYNWSCDDSAKILSDTSHPLYTYFYLRN